MSDLYGLKVIVSPALADDEIVCVGTGSTPMPKNWATMTEDEKLAWALAHSTSIAGAKNIYARWQRR